jgi:two-component system, NtrC family, sensor kinase
MGQERKGRGRKAGRRKAEVPLRRSEAKIKTLAQSKSRAVRAGADKSQNAEVTRLASELNEALAQQSASSDVLRVINSSPGNLAPVFEAIVDKALRICDAGFGGLWMVEGEVARPAATRNVPKAYSQFLMRQALSLTEAFGSGIEDKPFNHVTDLSRTESYRRRMSLTVASVELGGIRSYLAVPLRDGGALAAVLSVYRKEVRPFSARQITLLQGFAMQAEIAMKNARLLKETQEGLKRQTATSDILKVIANSPSNVQPVFEAMLDKAISLCGAKFGTLFLFDGKGFTVAADRNLPREYAKAQRGRSFSPEANAGFRFLVERKSTLHVADMFADASYSRGETLRKAAVELGGVRSLMAVPLLKKGKLIGNFSIYRKDPGGFAENQIALVENFASQAVIAIENARLFNETKEALERQTATAEVLKIISSSPRDLEPVFKAMLGNAMRICDAKFGHLLLYDGERFHATHLHDVPEAYRTFWDKHGPIHPNPNTALGRLVRTRQVIHIPDLKLDPAYAAREPLRIVTVDLAGARSFLAVPMLKETGLAGAIVIYRQEVQPFTDEQIALVENFASQAVIAIENARLFNETQESLQQQTATADVLKVISRSAFDLQTVLQTLVESAAELCEADFANIWRPEGSAFRLAASFGIPGKDNERLENAKYLGKIGMEPGRGSIVGRVLLEKRTVQVHDVQADPEYELNEIIRIGDYRTVLGVPLLREGVPIGVIFLSRCTVRPFTDKHIELVTTFADQAVIAIENVRLFDEVQARTRDLSESLQHQTATSQILNVISSSKADIQPAFSAIVGSAARLFEPCGVTITTLKHGQLYWNANAATLPDFDIERAKAIYPIPFDPERAPSARALLERRIIEIPDITAPDTPEFARKAAAAGGFQSATFVPLIKQDKGIGTIILTHLQAGFKLSEKQLALVRTFADQAVIAIENARLFEEVQARTRDLEESLQQQTATAEVLKVITRSTFNLQTVLDTLVESATRLCDAQDALIFLPSGNVYHAVARFGFTPEYHAYIGSNPIQIDRGSVVGRTVIDKQLVHISDVLADPDYKRFDAQKIAGYRAVLGAPMLREGNVVGVIFLTRTRPEPFSEKQIELVKTFADQAIIAIENTRLFDEVQAKTRDLEESLQQQTATAEVLKVISSSPGDLKPVFDSILANATRICDAKFGMLFLTEGEAFRAVAMHGVADEYAEARRREPTILPGPGTTLHIASSTRQPFQIADIRAEPAYVDDPRRFAILDLAGARTIMGVLIVMEDKLVGVINIYRTELRPFTDKQVELVKNFSAQAVIAIENSRLLNELRESLQQQTATAEVLKTISRSTFDLPAVLQALVQTAAQLCDADKGTITRQKDGAFYRAESCGFSEEFMNYVRDVPVVVDRHTATGRALLEGVVVHIPDVAADADYSFGEGPRLGDYRALLGVPMLREGVPIGVITLTRTEPRGFTDKQIELATTFADQAAIAIQNVRLFNETTEALERQTATAEILQVIASSPSDVQPVFDAIAIRANSLVGGFSSTVFRFIEGTAHLKAFTPTTPEADEILKSTFPRPVADLAAFQMAQAGKVTQIPDTEAPTYELREIARARGYRSMLFAPLMNKDVSIGFIAVTRIQSGNFAEHHVQLLRTFADQAVIAIENARLFDEVQARTRELAKSLDDLRAAQDRLVQTEKLASLGQLTAGIAHEIKNPLNFVNNFSALSAELVDEMDGALEAAGLKDEKRGELDEIRKLLKSNLEKVVQHGKRADSIVKNMLLHSRSGSGERRPVEINAIIDESLNLAYHGARAEKQGFNITLERDFDPSAGIADVYPQEITRVLLNLVSNGFYAATKRATEAGNGFEPRLKAATKSLGDMVEIRIRDNGMGIPPDIREKIFNPFFTTKPAGEGTGLGLSMSHDIVVKQHGGTIDIATEPGAFTEFIITLPRTMIQPGAGEPTN